MGIDGVPVQEALSRLEKAWGRRQAVRFPTPEEFEAYQGPRSCAGRAGLIEVQDFIDFGPLLKWRSENNAKLKTPMTVSAALMWRLGKHERFKDLCIGTTVEVPAKDGLPKGVGIVVVRPADYFSRTDGLAEYVRDFNKQLDLTRERNSTGCKTLDAAAFIPVRMEAALFAAGSLSRDSGRLGAWD